MSQENSSTPQGGDHTPGPPQAGGYGYNSPMQYMAYQQYGYNSDAGDGSKTLRDYLMIIRERAWYLVLAIFVFTIGALLYNQSVMPEYQAQARFKLFRARISLDTRGQDASSDINRISDDKDFNTQIAQMQSTDIINRVAKRLNPDERKEALAPYQDGNIFTGALNQEEVIARCRKIVPERQTYVAVVQYTHPNKTLATKLANYFVEEIKRANEEENNVIIDPMVERLNIQLQQIKQDIQDLSTKRTALVKEKDIQSLTAGTSTALAELTQLTNLKEGDKRNYEEAAASQNQLRIAKENKLPTYTIPYIAKDESVSMLTNKAADYEIQLSASLKRYTNEHPTVIGIRQQLATARLEQAKAVTLAEAKLQSTYETAKANYENSTKRYAEKSAEVSAKAAALTDYETLSKEIKIREDNYTVLSLTYEKKRADQSISATPIKLIDPASASDRPVNKNIWSALLIGLALGTASGLAIVFLLSALDDRVKSAADIEHYVGIPLIGVIPKIAKLDNFKKARTVSNGADRSTTEAFHAIYSALKIHDKASKAKAMLTTSTTPSEGKSFFTTNLAMTYALHGEKVIVVDADLRLPNVGRSLQLEGDNGITKYQAGMITLDEAIYKNVVPNMDVLPVGASCKNPTQVLNSKKFAAMIEELKGRYDRVFIDSPPVGAVADSLNLMPQVDGALYVIKFNTVKRKSIKGNLRRLRESKVPVFGAVLNQIGLHVANHYTNTYDKAYNKYYHDNDPHAVEVKVED